TGLYGLHACLYNGCMAGHAAIVGAFIQIVAFDALYSSNTGPGSVIMRNNFFSWLHDVQIKRIAVIGLRMNEIACLQIVAGRSRVGILSPPLFMCCNFNQGIAYFG